MKKLILILMICAVAFALCACNNNNNNNNEGESIATQFIIFKYYDGGLSKNSIYYVYDRDTKIIYLYTDGVSHATMCPYYIMVNNAPTLAIYGVNYND